MANEFNIKTYDLRSLRYQLGYNDILLFPIPLYALIPWQPFIFNRIVWPFGWNYIWMECTSHSFFSRPFSRQFMALRSNASNYQWDRKMPKLIQTVLFAHFDCCRGMKSMPLRSVISSSTLLCRNSLCQISCH